MAESSELTTLILAAGASRRLGAPKQLVRLGQETLLRRSVRLAQSVAAGAVHVVLGAHASDCLAELRGTAAVPHLNPDWPRGMGGSLAFGIEKAARERDPLAVLLLHVDQYQVTEAELMQLVEAWRESPARVVVAAYAGTVGPPVIFPRHLFPELRGCAGDRGARELLLRQDARRLEMPAAAYDINSPEDLGALEKFWSRIA